MTTIAIRSCVECGEPYSPSEQQSGYDCSPYNYNKGIATHCLACWLGVSPRDAADGGMTQPLVKPSFGTHDAVRSTRSDIPGQEHQ